MYVFPPFFENKVNFLKLAIQGYETGESCDCSSFVLNFFNSTEKKYQFAFESKNVTNQIRFKILTPTLKVLHIYSNDKNVIKCNLWSPFWFMFSDNNIKFGSGNIYDENLLFSYDSPEMNDINQLGLRNFRHRLINTVKILDKDGKRMSDTESTNCKSYQLQSTVDDDINTCFLLTRSLYILEYSIGNGYTYLGNETYPTFIFKKSSCNILTEGKKLNIDLMVKNPSKNTLEACKEYSYEERIDFLFIEFLCINKSKLKINNMKLIIKTKGNYKNQLSFCEFSHNPLDMSYI